MVDEIPLAAISIFLYGSIAALSYYFYRKIVGKKQSMSSEIGRFDPPKILFFRVLFVSALLDLPMYFGCIAKGGPKDCEWDDVSYPIFWCFHLLSLIGYTFSVVTPPVLWIDIMHNKDGMIWNSIHPVDNTKRFFQISLLMFAILMLIQIILVAMYFNISNPEEFSSSNMLNATGTFLEPVSIIFVTCGCLWSGIQLQLYVRKVKLDSAKEMKFLFHLNITMSIIVLTYLTRGIFVLTLFYLMPSSYEKHTKCSYFAWLVYTRWLPYIFCSLCLINEMRVSAGASSNDNRTGVGESRRHRQSNTSSFFSVNSSFAAKAFTKLGLGNDMEVGEDSVAAVSRSLLDSVQEEDSMLSSQYSTSVLGSGIGGRTRQNDGRIQFSTEHQLSQKSMSNTDDGESPLYSFDQDATYVMRNYIGTGVDSNPMYPHSHHLSDDSGISSVMGLSVVKFSTGEHPY